MHSFQRLSIRLFPCFLAMKGAENIPRASYNIKSLLREMGKDDLPRWQEKKEELGPLKQYEKRLGQPIYSIFCSIHLLLTDLLNPNADYLMYFLSLFRQPRLCSQGWFCQCAIFGNTGGVSECSCNASFVCLSEMYCYFSTARCRTPWTTSVELVKFLRITQDRNLALPEVDPSGPTHGFDCSAYCTNQNRRTGHGH